MYDERIKRLREVANEQCFIGCFGVCDHCKISEELNRAADAIEGLLKAAKAMHTWIFLNSGDEQAAYAECGLTDEMNAALGYGGQFVAELQREDDDG